MKNKWMSVLIFGSFGLVVLGALGYYVAATKFPDLFRDEYGIVSSGAAKPIVDAQNDFKKKNGVFSRDLKSLVQIASEHFVIGYSADFPKEISSFCSDCLATDQSYKALIVFKNGNGISMWSVDSQGNFAGLGTLKAWPGQ